MSNGLLTDRDVKEQLNIVEKLLSGATSDDEFMAAMLRNQQILFSAIGSGQVITDKTDLPFGMAGLAVEPMDPNEPGSAVFDINGSRYIVTVYPSSEVNTNDVVFINGEGNEVAPANSVDDSQLLGIGSTQGSKRADSIERHVSDYAVTVQPGETKTVLKENVTPGSQWVEIGTTSKDDSRYIYKVDGTEIFDGPLATPLGLYNDLYRFPSPIKANSQIEVGVRRLQSAGSSADYVSKITYYEG
jgi:hypothetical protein